MEKLGISGAGLKNKISTKYAGNLFLFTHQGLGGGTSSIAAKKSKGKAKKPTSGIFATNL
jgi:hypothetical protein